MIEFSFKLFATLLKELKKKYDIITLSEYCITKPESDFIILRHDVDRKPHKALMMAKLENELGIKASYYFRCRNEIFDDDIIKQIKRLKHEIGYHYENLAQTNGNYEKAISSFGKNLAYLKNIYPIKTICMHGSPLSKWNNSYLWKKFKYTDYGIIADPAYNIDYNKVFYITDASRSWNNESVSVRDKVLSNIKYSINSSNDILDLIRKNKSPNRIMLSIHPHNWSENWIEWIYIFSIQSFNNQFKRILVKFNKKKRT